MKLVGLKNSSINTGRTYANVDNPNLHSPRSIQFYQDMTESSPFKKKAKTPHVQAKINLLKLQTISDSKNKVHLVNDSFRNTGTTKFTREGQISDIKREVILTEHTNMSFSLPRSGNTSPRPDQLFETMQHTPNLIAHKKNCNRYSIGKQSYNKNYQNIPSKQVDDGFL